MVKIRKSKSKVGKTTLSIGKRQKAGINADQTKKMKKSQSAKSLNGAKKSKDQTKKRSQIPDNDSSDNVDNNHALSIETESDEPEEDDAPQSDDSSENKFNGQAQAHDKDDEPQEETDDEEEEEKDESFHAIPSKQPTNNISTFSTKRSQGNESLSKNPPINRVFVTQLSNVSNQDSLKSFFQSNGLFPNDIFLPKGNFDDHKGFAFVGFDSVESASKAISLSGNILDGASIVIEFAKPRRGDDSLNNPSGGIESDILFVKNLSSSTTKEDVKNHFKGVKNVMIATNDDGSCRGHAFIQCQNSNSALSIKERMNNTQINGENISVDFATIGFSGRRQSGQFGGYGGRGGFQQNRGRGGFRGRDGNFRDKFGGGNFGRQGRGFSRGRGGFGNRGGPQFNRGSGRPQGNRIQFPDND